MLLNRVDGSARSEVNDVDSSDLSMEIAQQLAGELVTCVLHTTKTPPKEWGDKGQVSRWASGQSNPNLARLIQKSDGRKAMAKRLLESCEDVEVLDEWRVIHKRQA
jgi:hypothetical protein